MVPEVLPAAVIALASLVITGVLSWVPWGPTRENRKGGAVVAASAFAAVARGPPGRLTGSASSPVRPPTAEPSSPSPSMKKLSDPWVTCGASSGMARPSWFHLSVIDGSGQAPRGIRRGVGHPDQSADRLGG